MAIRLQKLTQMLPLGRMAAMRAWLYTILAAVLGAWTSVPVVQTLAASDQACLALASIPMRRRPILGRRARARVTRVSAVAVRFSAVVTGAASTLM